MTKEMWEKVREAAKEAARWSYAEAVTAQRGSLLGERIAWETLEAALNNHTLAALHHASVVLTAKAAHRAAYQALYVDMHNVIAHEVAETEYEDRSRWFGWGSPNGDSWAVVRRFMK